jgi:RNase P protein component
LQVAPENVGLQKEQKYNTFACHTCNEVRLCVLGIYKKEVDNTKKKKRAVLRNRLKRCIQLLVKKLETKGTWRREARNVGKYSA